MPGGVQSHLAELQKELSSNFHPTSTTQTGCHRYVRSVFIPQLPTLVSGYTLYMLVTRGVKGDGWSIASPIPHYSIAS